MAKFKDAFILTVITLIAGLLLGGVYELTKDPIAQQQIEKNAAAYRLVCPGAESFKNEDVLDEAVERAPEILQNSSVAMGNVVVNEALYACSSSGEKMGMVVKSTSKDGYGGNIQVVVGIRLDAGKITVTGMDYLEINETAGLGMNAKNPEFMDQFKNKTVDAFEVVKTGAAENYQIDALSGATKTSSAVTNAVNAAIVFAASVNQ